MSSRALQKAQLRAEREAAERREAEQLHRRRVMRLWMLAGLVAAAVAALAGLNAIGGGGSSNGADDGVAGTADGAAMLAGIPQDGTVLGDPAARVTLTEFADLQCPFCRDYAIEVLPQVIERYVRAGKVKLDLRLLRFIGPDSVRGAQAALTAAEQDRMWQFVDLWYRNQGTENTGYGDGDFVEDLAKAARVTNPLGSDQEAAMAKAEQDAANVGVDSTPSFLLDGERIQLPSLEYEALAAKLDAALAR